MVKARIFSACGWVLSPCLALILCQRGSDAGAQEHREKKNIPSYKGLVYTHTVYSTSDGRGIGKEEFTGNLAKVSFDDKVQRRLTGYRPSGVEVKDVKALDDLNKDLKADGASLKSRCISVDTGVEDFFLPNDGKSIFFTAETNDRKSLYRSDIDGKGRKAVCGPYKDTEMSMYATCHEGCHVILDVGNTFRIFDTNKLAMVDNMPPQSDSALPLWIGKTHNLIISDFTGVRDHGKTSFRKFNWETNKTETLFDLRGIWYLRGISADEKKIVCLKSGLAYSSPNDKTGAGVSGLSIIDVETHAEEIVFPVPTKLIDGRPDGGYPRLGYFTSDGENMIYCVEKFSRNPKTHFKIISYQLGKKTETSIFEGQCAGSTEFTPSPDGKFVAYICPGSPNNAIVIADAPSWKTIINIDVGEDTPRSVRWIPEGNSIETTPK